VHGCGFRGRIPLFGRDLFKEKQVTHKHTTTTVHVETKQATRTLTHDKNKSTNEPTNEQKRKSGTHEQRRLGIYACVFGYGRQEGL